MVSRQIMETDCKELDRTLVSYCGSMTLLTKLMQVITFANGGTLLLQINVHISRTEQDIKMPHL